MYNSEAIGQRGRDEGNDGGMGASLHLNGSSDTGTFIILDEEALLKGLLSGVISGSPPKVLVLRQSRTEQHRLVWATLVVARLPIPDSV
jgi:hypothetical protein